MSCYAKSIEYNKIDAKAEIAKIIKTISSSPSQESTPQAYIGQHPQEYQSLISYGEYTLDYCYNLFAKGGQTGLEGQIMAAACRDILEVKGIKLNTIQYNSGQDWYNAVKDKWPSINIK